MYYYDQLSESKPEVKKLLEEYFQFMESVNYFIDKQSGKMLGLKYIFSIGRFYRRIGFKIQMFFVEVFYWGFFADLLLLFLGILKKLDYIPIITIALLAYWGYLKIFYENKNKVYGIGY